LAEGYAKLGGGGLNLQDWTFPEEDRAQFTTAPWRGRVSLVPLAQRRVLGTVAEEEGARQAQGAEMTRKIRTTNAKVRTGVTQKLAAQAVPVIGALGGAAVNYAFIDRFQEVARAHFVVRRLERCYGKSAVRAAYERL
jgi:EcsC family protein